MRAIGDEDAHERCVVDSARSYWTGRFTLKPA